MYHIGNHQDINLEYQDSNLKDKKILFLGSSVTRGAASLSESFADMLQQKYGIIAIKEVVDGTTLVDIADNSYISRLKKINPLEKFDAVVVQLSTNDAFHDFPILSCEQPNIEDSIKEIVSYVKETWNIPVIFYTCPFYDHERYLQMVNLVLSLSKRDNFTIVDIYNSEKFKSLSAYDKGLYMYDANHPTKIGYFHMLPYFEKELSELFKK